ncbi:hypothetical protein MMC22_004100 [Lobaria immixta]|nr:hypothetical protein [Lobaria immixta]
MGKLNKRLLEFIETVPDGKLEGFPPDDGELYSDEDFHLTMKKTTAQNPAKVVLKILLSSACSISTVKNLDPEFLYLSHCVVGVDDTAAMNRVALKGGMTI